MKRNLSEPRLNTNTLAVRDACENNRRKSTVLNPADLWDPRSMLQLILSQPNHALIGITPNLRPLIESTISELRDLESDQRHHSDPKLIDEALLRLEVQQFKSGCFSPLEASIVNFESILGQKYTSCLMYAVCHALVGSFLSGFNTSLLNIPAHLIQNECHLTIYTFSELQSMYCVGGLFGALCAGYIADTFGRQPTLLLANGLFMLSGFISMLYCFEFFGPIDECFMYFIASRVISGISSGISTAIVPTYLGEIAPPLIRGEIGSLNAFINAFGILFAEIIGFEYILGSTTHWKYLFVVNIFPFIIQCAFINSFCESPQWFLLNRNPKEAEQVFMCLRDSDNVELDMKSFDTKRYYYYQLKKKKQRICKKQSKNNHNKIKSQINNRSSLLVLDDVAEYGAVDDIKEKGQNISVLIYIYFVAIMLQILQQLSGINSVWYYSSIMLQESGLRSPLMLWIGNILIASTNFFGVLIPVQLIEKLGRKMLIYISCSGMIAASLLLSMVLMFTEEIESISGYLSVSLLIFYVISFAIGLGPIVGLLTVELAPSSHRATIVSIAFFINYAANYCVAQYANVLVQYMYYIPFAVCCSFGILFVNVFVVETQAKTEAEIQRQLLEKNIYITCN